MVAPRSEVGGAGAAAIDEATPAKRRAMLATDTRAIIVVPVCLQQQYRRILPVRRWPLAVGRFSASANGQRPTANSWNPSSRFVVRASHGSSTPQRSETRQVRR